MPKPDSGVKSQTTLVSLLEGQFCVFVAVMLAIAAISKLAAGDSLLFSASELALAIWLFSGAKRISAILTVSLLFAAFLGVHLRGFHNSSACRCMGHVEVPNKVMLTLCGVTVALGIWLVVRSRQFRSYQLGVASLFLIALGMGYILQLDGVEQQGIQLEGGPSFSTAADAALLDPQSWMGRRLPLLDCLESETALASGAWTIAVVQPDCAKCREFVNGQFRSAIIGEQKSEPAIISLAAQGPAFAFSTSIPVFETTQCRKKWFGETPFVIQLKDGVVVSTGIGSL